MLLNVMMSPIGKKIWKKMEAILQNFWEQTLQQQDVNFTDALNELYLFGVLCDVTNTFLGL